MAKLKRHIFSGAFIACLTVILSSTAVFAQATPLPGTPSCDVNYWESLKSRAWAEAQREITQNQNLIFKADSVLEYTCFPEWVGTPSMATSAGNIFSQAAPLNSSLNAFVLPAVNAYINNSFGHDYLGGRFGLIAEPATAPQTFCSTMDRVWEKAKCMNFFEPAPEFALTDGFYSLVEYAFDADRRAFPQNRPCQGRTTAHWQDQLGKAYNIPDGMVGANGARVDRPSWIAHRDPYVLNVTTIIRPKLVPGACTDFIPTGVDVFAGPGATSGYPDAICTNPGCVYIQGSGCQSAGSPAGVQGGGGGGGLLPGLFGG